MHLKNRTTKRIAMEDDQTFGKERQYSYLFLKIFQHKFIVQEATVCMHFVEFRWWHGRSQGWHVVWKQIKGTFCLFESRWNCLNSHRLLLQQLLPKVEKRHVLCFIVWNNILTAGAFGREQMIALLDSHQHAPRQPFHLPLQHLHLHSCPITTTAKL